MSLCQANSQIFTASNGTWRQVQFFSTVSTSPGGKFGQKSPPKSPLLVERNHILIQTTQFILQCNALRAFAVSYLDNQYRSQYNPDSFALISVYAVMHLRIEDSRPIVRTLSTGGGTWDQGCSCKPVVCLFIILHWNKDYKSLLHHHQHQHHSHHNQKKPPHTTLHHNQNSTILSMQ